MSSFINSSNYPHINAVQSFDQLASTKFADRVNALCWPRALRGDFSEVMAQVGSIDEITTLDDESLMSLTLSKAGSVARDLLIKDQQRLRDLGLSPSLDCIPHYLRDPDAGPVPTDVYSFHVDSATAETDTWLCCYHGPTSEGLSNEDALRRVDIPETRAGLLKRYGGADDADFLAYLNEHCFDLHYIAKPGANPFPFGVGNLWRIATQYPGSPVPPCIHRAPATRPGDRPRLLLIS